MGRHSEEVEIERRSLRIVGRTFEGIRVMEMGAMEHKTPPPRCPASEWYLEHGAKEVVSVDLNGKWDSLVHDLDTPLPAEHVERYHLVTNYGTGEHVNNQYTFFKNMHDACRTGGLMIHNLLHVGYAPGHGRYYYSQKTAARLAELCSYAIVGLENYACSAQSPRGGMILVAFRKRKNSKFPSEFRFLKRAAIVDTGDVRRTGDYNAAGHGTIK